MKYEPKEKEYNQYVETVTPTSNSFRNCLWAFLVGGLICTIGQGLFNLLQYFGWNKNDSSSYVSVILVLISVILTGFNLYKFSLFCLSDQSGRDQSYYRSYKFT